MVIDCKKISNNILESLKNKIEVSGKILKLVIIQIGNDEISNIYIRNKIKSATSIGIECIVIKHSLSISNTNLLKEINKLNKDKSVNGIIIQLPLPRHLNKSVILSAIDPEKDIDGFHPLNRGKLSSSSNIIPATPKGIIKILESLNVDYTSKRCLVIGRSDIVGLPISILLSNDNNIGKMTVIIAQIWEKNIKELCLMSDVIIVAAGSPNLIPSSDWVKEGTIIIDIGINRIDDKIIGDTNFEVLKDKCYITPVPGGVGLLTVASLLENLVEKNI